MTEVDHRFVRVVFYATVGLGALVVLKWLIGWTVLSLALIVGAGLGGIHYGAWREGQYWASHSSLGGPVYHNTRFYYVVPEPKYIKMRGHG